MMVAALALLPVGLLVVAAALVRRGAAAVGIGATTGPRWERLPERWSAPVRRATLRQGGEGELGDLLRLRAALAGGRSVVHALDDVGRGRGPWADRSRVAAGRLRAGLPLTDVLEAWTAGAGPVAATARDAVLLATATGGSVVGALDAAVEVARARAGLAREVRLLSAPARASALLVAGAPVAFALLLVAVDARVRAFYTATWAGLACLAVGGLLDGVGAWWMASLARRVR